MGAKRKSYTPKYRQDAAHLVIDTGRTIAQVARDIGVGEQLLGRWVAIERSRMDDPPDGAGRRRAGRAGPVTPRGHRAADGPGVPEKSSGLLRHGELEPERAFEVIDAQKATFTASPGWPSCSGCPGPGYYAWAASGGPLARRPREARRLELVGKIEAAHDASDGVNGAPRITADLREAGEVISVKTTAKLMRQNGIRGISPRPWRPVTTIVRPEPARHPGPGRAPVRPGRR